MELSMRAKLGLTGLMLGFFHVAIIAITFNLFVAPYYEIKIIPWQVWLGGSFVYVLQKPKLNPERMNLTDEQYIKFIDAGQDAIRWKIVTIAILLAVYFNNYH